MVKFASVAAVAAVAVVACAMGVAARAPKWHELDGYSFEQYQADFGKHYASFEERAERLTHFQRNLDAVRAHNALNKSWKEGINHLSDRSPEEVAKLRGYDRALGYSSTGNGLALQSEHNIDVSSLPKSVDWRGKGAVTAVKDQGQCGSCWTFASAETLESAHYLKTGILLDLSEQQIASCTDTGGCGGTGGCEGGTAEKAYAGLMANGRGIASEWVYPYTSHAGSDAKCIYSATMEVAANITSYTKLPSNQAAPLMQAVATVGPIAISVDASAWSRYESGVFDGCNLKAPVLDHAVQLVGYGSDAAFGDYWLVRNSWTPVWGEKGYIRVKRYDPTNPPCGTDSSPASGSGCPGGPSEVTVCGNCGILYDNCYPVV